jgi:hypothetical protein
MQLYLCADAHPYNLISYIVLSLIIMDSFDPKSLALPNTGVGRSVGQKPPRHRQGEKFLKGPIPWKWIAKAARLPGKALQVALALWFLAGIKSKSVVALSGSVLRDIGVLRHSGYRGLKELEKAGLISVQRHEGRSPVVTILE